jgi:predicted nucleic acid-binding protein
MISGLLDTSILIDLVRNYLPAHAWIVSQPDLGVPELVWFELLEGSENKLRQGNLLKLLRRFQKVNLERADLDWGLSQFTRYQLSHGVGAFDCLIAAPSFRLKLPLYTLNLKHFTPILGALAQRPY